MKTIKGTPHTPSPIASFAAVIILLTHAPHVRAIEGLTAQVQCPNIVLSWPSVDTESYIVQFKTSLDTSSPWVTLTNPYPAAYGTNMTYFVHAN